jgi:hypothetical protein
MIEKVRRGYPMPTWTDDAVGPTGHRDFTPKDERFSMVPYVVPHARVAVGLWEDAVALLDEAGMWVDEEQFVNCALREYIAKEQAVALRRIGESRLGIHPRRVEVAAPA